MHRCSCSMRWSVVTRVSRTEAARHLGVSISTIDRQIQRGQLSTEKEPYGTRERVWVLLDENSVADSDENSSVTAGAAARSSSDDTTADYVRTLEHQMKSLQELADYRQKELQESELRFQQVLSNLTTAQQTIERMSRALPVPEDSAPESRRSWSWWPWRRNSRNHRPPG